MPVPASDAIGFDLAVRTLVLIGGVVDGNTPLFLDRFADTYQQRGVWPRFPARRSEEHVRRDGLEAFAPFQWEHTVDLGQCASYSYRGEIDLQPRAAQQTQHDRGRFLFSKQQRRQLKAWA